MVEVFVYFRCDYYQFSVLVSLTHREILTYMCSKEWVIILTENIQELQSIITNPHDRKGRLSTRLFYKHF